jgi:histidine triad (HIT) family protein
MCIFCQIVSKEIPAVIIFEDEEIVAFKDIHPAAPVHLLIIPKKHLSSLAQSTVEDQELLGKLLGRVKILAEEQGIAQTGYKVVINTGKNGGQLVEHLHLHLLGGREVQKLV